MLPRPVSRSLRSCQPAFVSFRARRGQSALAVCALPPPLPRGQGGVSVDQHEHERESSSAGGRPEIKRQRRAIYQEAEPGGDRREPSPQRLGTPTRRAGATHSSAHESADRQTLPLLLRLRLPWTPHRSQSTFAKAVDRRKTLMRRRGSAAEARRPRSDVGAGQREVEPLLDDGGLVVLAEPGQAFVVAVQAPDVVRVLAGAAERVVEPEVGAVDGFGLLDAGPARAAARRRRGVSAASSPTARRRAGCRRARSRAAGGRRPRRSRPRGRRTRRPASRRRRRGCRGRCC